MLRVTIELLPGGSEVHKRVIGLMEICNLGGDPCGKCAYAVVLKKTEPFAGALKAAWKKGVVSATGDFADSVGRLEDDEIHVEKVEGFDRVKRGSYDLVYLALRACGLDKRNP